MTRIPSHADSDVPREMGREAIETPAALCLQEVEGLPDARQEERVGLSIGFYKGQENICLAHAQ